MKTKVVRLVLGLSLVALAASLQAQPTAHYVPGVEGVKAASLPPPGWYVRDYNVGYYAGQVNNSMGDSFGPPNFEAATYANVPRVIWISETQLLGGYVGVDALLPLVYQQVHHSVPPRIVPTPYGPVVVRRYDSSNFGIGDLFAESTLSWHLKQFDFSGALGVWMPTGNFEVNSTQPGLGYWTPMLTAGGTWYLDTNKTWAVSALCRYELNTEQRDTHVTRGNAFTLEWGVSKTLNKIFDVGVVGYYQQKVTGDSGPVALHAPHDLVAAVGPEFSVVFPEQMLFVSLRYLNEFAAENRAQGHTFSLTLTKRF
jgi:hypothetical protein